MFLILGSIQKRKAVEYNSLKISGSWIYICSIWGFKQVVSYIQLHASGIRSRRTHMHSCFGCWLFAHTSSVQCYSKFVWYLQCPFRLQMYFMVHTGKVIQSKPMKKYEHRQDFWRALPMLYLHVCKMKWRKKKALREDSRAEYVLTNVSTLARMYVSV